jgi:valyl-tRNA synthetase
MPKELPIHYDFESAHERIYQKWIDAGAMYATPDDRTDTYVIMMPLPNVTGALHMGHAMDNVMQDLLIRYNRMQGRNTLWMPGCDHAGIATQAVIEKRLLEREGKTRHDIGREALVARIWNWKDEYQKRIIDQQQQMGCSCAWDLHRFTMDPVCARAVREAFFRMFKDKLIYRGNRMVNWDCHLQTAVSDDEIVREAVQGHFWHLKYPVIDAQNDEPEFVVVATTRPETMLGDTAVAVHPDPESSLKVKIDLARTRLAGAGEKERPALEEEVSRLEERLASTLPDLIRLRDMAADGRYVELPLLKRRLPLILDEWAKPELGSGCVKVTPAHDPNDYEVWKRHQDSIGIINVLNEDGTYNANAGPYADLDRNEVRKQVLADLEKLELVLEVEDREIELGLSDRSNTPIEPLISKQWFVNMGDVDGGILCGKDTGREFTAPGLAQIAIDAVTDDWKSPTGRNLTFYPDKDRYTGTYVNWLAEKRDWCISRQLWWGHQIPIWHGELTSENSRVVLALVDERPSDVWAWVADDAGELLPVDTSIANPNANANANTNANASANTNTERAAPGGQALLVCIRGEAVQADIENLLVENGLERDPDVLDTWFSSGLWPFSTLGWPDSENAEVSADHTKLGAAAGHENYLDYYYPGNCLVTGRDIITLWVARMTILGLYLLGDVPFTESFIHANIQDGKGVRMSKSKGNGIDPVDIINEYGADAMRYVICDMQTGSQDIKLPVQAISPFTQNRIDLATAKHGRTVFTYIDPETGKEFDVLGTFDELPKARVTSDRFEGGKAFCTKLWNAARFAFINLEGYEFSPIEATDLAREDEWILSRLFRAIGDVTDALSEYNPSSAVGAAREFFWNDLCDWYLEIIKPRLSRNEKASVARTVLAYCLDRVLRLFHPFVPYITETLWEELNTRAPRRGLDQEIEVEKLLISGAWPETDSQFIHPDRETEFELVQDFVRAVRDVRARFNIGLSKPISATVKATGETLDRLNIYRRLISHLVNIESLEIGPDVVRPQLSTTSVVGDTELYLEGLLDPEKEREKLGKQREKLANGVAQTQKKLANERFIENAPAAVVEKEKARLEELTLELELVERSLSDLA